MRAYGFTRASGIGRTIFSLVLTVLLFAGVVTSTLSMSDAVVEVQTSEMLTEGNSLETEMVDAPAPAESDNGASSGTEGGSADGDLQTGESAPSEQPLADGEEEGSKNTDDNDSEPAFPGGLVSLPLPEIDGAEGASGNDLFIQARQELLLTAPAADGETGEEPELTASVDDGVSGDESETSDCDVIAAAADVTVSSQLNLTLSLSFANSSSLASPLYGTVTVTHNTDPTKSYSRSQSGSGTKTKFFGDDNGDGTFSIVPHTVTVTAPEGYFISSVSNASLTALNEENWTSTFRTYTLSGFTANQTISVKYGVDTISTKSVFVNLNNSIGAYTADVSVSASSGTIGGGSAVSIASRKCRQASTNSSAYPMTEDTCLTGITIDPSEMSPGHSITAIAITHNGTSVAYDFSASLPIPAGGDPVTLDLQSLITSVGQESIDAYVVELTYERTDSVVTVEHLNTYGSAGSYNRADMKLTLAGGMTQNRTSTVTLEGDSSYRSFTVSAGAELDKIDLSGYRNGLGLASVKITGLPEGSLIIPEGTFPAAGNVTLYFAEDTLMPSEGITVSITYTPVYEALLTIRQSDVMGASVSTALTTDAKEITITPGESAKSEASVTKSAAEGKFYLQASDDGVRKLSSLTVSRGSFDVSFPTEVTVTVTPKTGSPTVLSLSGGDLEWSNDFALINSKFEIDLGGYEVPDSADIDVCVEFGHWGTVTTANIAEDSLVDADKLPDIILNSSTEIFYKGTGSRSTEYRRSNNDVRYVEPGGKLQTLKVVWGSSILNNTITDIIITVTPIDGSEATVLHAADLGWADSFPSDRSNLSLTFPDGGLVVPMTGASISVEVIHDSWNTITLKQSYVSEADDNNQFPLLEVQAPTNSSAFVTKTDTGSSAVSSFSTDKEPEPSRIIVPGAQLKTVVLSWRNSFLRNTVVDIILTATPEDGSEPVVLHAADLGWDEQIPSTAAGITFEFPGDNGYVVPANTDITIEVVYDDWNTITVNQGYAPDTEAFAEGDLEKFGVVTVNDIYAGEVSIPADAHAFYYLDAQQAEHSFKTDSTQSTGARRMQPDHIIRDIVINQPSHYTLCDFEVMVYPDDGEAYSVADRIEISDFEMTGYVTLTFTDGGLTIPYNADIVVDIVYDDWNWSDLTVVHTYHDSVQDTSASFGAVNMKGSRAAFWRSTTSNSTEFSVPAGATTGSSILQSGKVLKTMTVMQPNGHSLIDVIVTVAPKNGESDPVDISDIVTWPEASREYSTVRFAFNGTDGYVIPKNSDITIELVYGDWSELTLEQGYAADVSEPGDLGVVTLKGTQNMFWRLSATGGSRSKEFKLNKTEEATCLVPPGKTVTSLTVVQPARHSLVDVIVTVEYEDGSKASEDVSDRLVWPETPVVTGTVTLTFGEDGFTIPANARITVRAEYGEWSTVTLRQSYAEGTTGDLGAATLIGESKTFYGNTGTISSQLSLDKNTAEKESLARPGRELDRLNVNLPNKRIVKEIKATLVDRSNGEETRTDISGKFVLQENSSTAGSVQFKIEDCVITAHTDIIIDVVYGFADASFTVIQSYASGVDPVPSSFGTVALETYGNRITAEGSSSAVQQYRTTSGTGRGSIASGATMSSLKITSPNRIYPISNVNIFVNGEDVTASAGTFSKTTSDGKQVWTYRFNSGYSFPDNSEVEFRVEYDKWKTYELKQYYAEGIEPQPTSFGTLNVQAVGTSFISDKSSATDDDATISRTEASGTGLIEPNAQLKYIQVTPPTSYSVIGIKVFVDDNDVTGEAINWESESNAAPSAGVWKLWFKDGYTVPAGSTLRVEAEYGNWERYELSQYYAEGVVPKPEILGKLKVEAVQQSFIPEGTSRLEYDATIFYAEEDETGLIKPDAQLKYIEVTPTTPYSVRRVKVFIDDNDVTGEAINWESDDSAAPSAGVWKLYFSEDFVVPAGSTLRVEAEYGNWERYELSQYYAAYIESPSATLGKLKVEAVQQSFIPEGTSRLEYDATIFYAEEGETGLIKPDAQLKYIEVTPTTPYSVRRVKVFVDDNDVTGEAINWDSENSVTPHAGMWTLWFKDGYTVPAGSTLRVEAEYGEWETYIIEQQYTESVKPAPTSYGTFNVEALRQSFFPQGGSRVEYNVYLNRNTAKAEGYLKPDSTLQYANAAPPAGYAVVGIDVYVDGEMVEDAIDYEHSGTIMQSSGQWKLYFTEGFTVPDGSSLRVVVTYGEWCDFTITQEYAENVIPVPSEYGTVNVFSDYYRAFFIDGSRLFDRATASATDNQVTQKLRPDYTLDYMTVIPPSNHSVLGVDVYVDGVLSEDAIDFSNTRTQMSSTGTWRLHFAPDFSVSTGSEIEVVVTYGDWFEITLRQENLLQDALGKMSIKSDRYNGFISDSSYARNFELSSAESDTRLVHPNATISGLVVTPPTGLSILEAKATITQNNITSEWLIDGESAVKLNDDGTVSLTAAQPDGDIVIEVKYGAHLYVRSNVDGVVTVDSTAVGTEFAKLCDISSNKVNLEIVAADGWKITSVSYGTSKNAQNTELNGQGSAYAVSSIASDIYVDISVENDCRKLTAKQEGEGAVSITYKGTETALATSAKTLDSAVVIGSEVKFSLTAAENTEIVDVLVNGSSIGDERSFTMPGEDTEIVVKTELKLVNINAVLTGDGKAEAVYSNASVELESTEKTVAADVEAGTYEIIIRPLEGSEIVSVSIGSTVLAPADGSEDVYSVVVSDKDVLITVDARALESYSIYAKANIVNAAELGGAKLTTDYEVVANGYENGGVSLELNVEPGYEVVEVKCGDTADALAVIEPADGIYRFDNLASDKYVEVTLEKLLTITVNRTGDGVVFTNGGNVDVSNTSYSVQSSTDHSFDFIPLEGEKLISVSVQRGDGAIQTLYTGEQVSGSSEGVPLGSREFSYTLSDVTEDCVLYASFTEPENYEIHVIKKGTGKGSFALGSEKYTDSFTVTVEEGTSHEITIKADKGYAVVSVKMGASENSATEVKLVDSVLSVPAITSDVYVIVELKQESGSGGTMDPDTGDHSRDNSAAVSLAMNLALMSVLAGSYCVGKLYHRKREY